MSSKKCRSKVVNIPRLKISDVKHLEFFFLKKEILDITEEKINIQSTSPECGRNFIVVIPFNSRSWRKEHLEKNLNNKKLSEPSMKEATTSNKSWFFFLLKKNQVS